MKDVLDILIAVLILGLVVYMVYTEREKKVQTDLFIDTALAVIVVGVAIINLIATNFIFSSVITYLYLIIILFEAYNIYLFVKRHRTKAGKISKEIQPKETTDESHDE